MAAQGATPTSLGPCAPLLEWAALLPRHRRLPRMPPVDATPEPIPFSQLGLAGPLLLALAEVGYETPSPIQAATIPPLLAGRDVLGQPLLSARAQLYGVAGSFVAPTTTMGGASGA